MKNTLRINYQWGNEVVAKHRQIDVNAQELKNHGKIVKKTIYSSYIGGNTMNLYANCTTFLHATKFWCYAEIIDNLTHRTEKTLSMYNTKKEAQTYARGFKRRIYRRYPGIKTYSEDI